MVLFTHIVANCRNQEGLTVRRGRCLPCCRCCFVTLSQQQCDPPPFCSSFSNPFCTFNGPSLPPSMCHLQRRDVDDDGPTLIRRYFQSVTTRGDVHRGYRCLTCLNCKEPLRRFRERALEKIYYCFTSSMKKKCRWIGRLFEIAPLQHSLLGVDECRTRCLSN